MGPIEAKENANIYWERQSLTGKGALATADMRGSACQGLAKRLTFTEGRLRLPKGTTRLESQAFRWLCDGTDDVGLELFASFSFKRKGRRFRRQGEVMLLLIRHHLRLVQGQEMLVEQ